MMDLSPFSYAITAPISSNVTTYLVTRRTPRMQSFKIRSPCHARLGGSIEICVRRHAAPSSSTLPPRDRYPPLE